MKTQDGWDSWYDSYLQYLQDVLKKATSTVRDIRCTLKRVSGWHNGFRGIGQLPDTTVLPNDDYAIACACMG
jgi:hypothetical protein